MDKVFVEKLLIFANHGVYDFEKERGQMFEITVEVTTDFSKASNSDNVDDVLSYGSISRVVNTTFRSQTCDLLETIGEHVITALFVEFPQIKEVILTIKKPKAPVKLHFESMGITISRKRSRVYIGLGSNIGDSNSYFDQAISLLKEDNRINVLRESSRIITKPFGDVIQDDFLNSAIEISTFLKPQQLLSILQEIELKLQRVRTIKWGPRTIDLDILYFENEKIYEDNLIVPHYQIQEREFVLKSLVELAPYFIHPVLNKTNMQLLKELEYEN